MPCTVSRTPALCSAQALPRLLPRPLQAAASALAGTLGTGNIAGVGVAVAIGGAGALFWMWVVALLAAVAKYAEIVLGMHYREKDPETGIYRGGFMYIVKKGLGENWRWLAFIWSLLFFMQFLISGAVQSNSISDVINHSFGGDHLVVGIVIAFLAGLVILGGIKRIGKVAEKMVPIMAVIYTVAALFIIFANITEIPVAHATATVDHPVRQGIWGIFEVFVDTIIVCTMTGLIIVITGVIPSGEVGASLTATAFQTGLPGPGDLIVTISILLFAYTTILVAEFYSETGAVYCFGNKVIMPVRIIFLVAIVIGAVGGLRIVWGLLDLFMGVTVAINLILIIAMRKKVLELTKDFFNNVMGMKE